MASKIVCSQYDNGVKILFTIKKDSIVQNIDNSIIRVKFNGPGKIPTKEAVVIDGENGQAMIVLFSDDLSIPGAFTTRVETTFPSGTKLSEDNPFLLTVVPEQEGFERSPEIIEDVPSFDKNTFLPIINQASFSYAIGDRIYTDKSSISTLAYTNKAISIKKTQTPESAMQGVICIFSFEITNNTEFSIKDISLKDPINKDIYEFKPNSIKIGSEVTDMSIDNIIVDQIDAGVTKVVTFEAVVK